MWAVTKPLCTYISYPTPLTCPHVEVPMHAHGEIYSMCTIHHYSDISPLYYSWSSVSLGYIICQIHCRTVKPVLQVIFHENDFPPPSFLWHVLLDMMVLGSYPWMLASMDGWNFNMKQTIDTLVKHLLTNCLIVKRKKKIVLDSGEAWKTP